MESGTAGGQWTKKRRRDQKLINTHVKARAETELEIEYYSCEEGMETD